MMQFSIQLHTWQLGISAAEHFRQKILSFGKPEHSVFVSIAIGLDHVEHTPLLSLSELATIYTQFYFAVAFLLVTYHPVTLGDESPTLTFLNILEALDQFPQSSKLSSAIRMQIMEVGNYCPD